MDPITIVLLSIAGVAIAPTVAIKVGSWAIVKSKELKQERKRNKEIQRTYRPTEKQKREKAMEEKLSKTKINVDRFRFRGITSKIEKFLTLKEMSEYDKDKDELLHGTLKVVDYNGNVTTEDIYLYQPRVMSANNNLIGPKKEKNGTISARNCYLCRADGSNEILRGYIPKREVLSNLCYDFDYNSQQRFIDRFPDVQTKDEEYQRDTREIEKFIQIEFDKDANGNFVTVDRTNPKEEARFQKYISDHKNNRLQPRDYFLNKIKIAESAFKNYLEKTKPNYAKANIQTQKQDETVLKVENSKKAENPYAWYDRFNYYLPSMLGDRVQVGDTIEHGAPHGGMHHGGPGHGPRR